MALEFLHVLIIIISQAKYKKKGKNVHFTVPLVARCKGSDVSKEKLPTESAEQAELVGWGGSEWAQCAQPIHGHPVLGGRG